MITGDVNNFAIKWEVIEFTEDFQWIYGHFSLLVGGHSLGNYGDLTTLSLIFGWIENYISQEDEIIPVFYNELSKESIISHILSNYSNEFQGTLSSPHVARELSDLPFPLEIDIKHIFYSAFYGWEMLLINNLKDQRLIWHNRRTNDTGETYLPALTVQTVMRRALEDYKDQVASLPT